MYVKYALFHVRLICSPILETHPCVCLSSLLSLLPRCIPLYGYTTIYLCTHLLFNLWFFFRFWLSWTNLPRASVYKSLCGYMFSGFFLFFFFFKKTIEIIIWLFFILLLLWITFSNIKYIFKLHILSDQIRSVAQSCPTLCDPMNHSTPGLPVHHQLPEFTQTHVHWVQWCHPAISSSVVPFSSCPQSLPASESFPMSQLFTRGGQSTGVSASASFLPKKSQGWCPSEWISWISLQSKGL